MAQVCFKALRPVQCKDGSERVKAIGNVMNGVEHGECISMFVNNAQAIAWLEQRINEWPLFEVGELEDEVVDDATYKRIKQGGTMKRIGFARPDTAWEF